MSFSVEQVQFLLFNIPNATAGPVCLCSPQWKAEGSAGPDFPAFEKFARKCADGADVAFTGRALGIRCVPYLFQGTLVEYVLFSSEQDESAVRPYLFALMDFLLSKALGTDFHSALRVRVHLTNQLASFGKINWETISFMNSLNYSFDVPRCAVLFYFPVSQDKVSPLNIQESLDLLLSTVLHFSSEDIFGPISQSRFLVFKKVSGATVRDMIAEARQYAEKSIAMLHLIYRVEVIAYVGSPYNQLESLHNSYLEAQFLGSNSDFFHARRGSCLTIDRFLLPYLSSLLPHQTAETLFKAYDLVLSRSALLSSTLRAITTNDTNLTGAAKELGVHRNTVLQRFGKLQETLSADPLHNDADRMALHCYSFLKSQTITWHAYVNIQPGNIQQLGLQKFSELLFEKSGGRMQLYVDFTSSAGDYRQLLESVCSGAVDCASVEICTLFSVLRGQPNVLELPFLFDSREEANTLLRTFVKDELSPSLYAMGAILGDFWSMGWRYLTSNEPVRVPEDLCGKRIRTTFFSQIKSSYFRAMSASVIHMLYFDVPKYLATDVVDCQENPYSNLLGMYLYERQKYILELNAFYDINSVLLSKTAFEKLPPSLREVVLDALHEASEWLLSETVRVNAAARQQLMEKGMHCTQPTAREIQLWRAAGADLYRSLEKNRLLKGLLLEKEAYHDKKRAEGPV